MTVVGSLNAIAVKAETITGLKRCYGPGGSEGVTGGGTVRPIPRGIDDGPVGIVWLGSSSQEGGNAEALLVEVNLDIWIQADNSGWAYQTLAAFCDLARTAFRSDMDLGGQADRCQMVGWDEPLTETVNNRQFLVLPIRLPTLITRFAADASA